MTGCIHYADGYKYQLREVYRVMTGIIPPKPIVTPWLALATNGELTISAGYAWDGPSGPTIDTPDSMRGSLVHDGFYQLIREGFLDARFRDLADALLRAICIEDGMWPVRADAWYVMVQQFGAPSIDPAKASPDKCAPLGCGPLCPPAQHVSAGAAIAP